MSHFASDSAAKSSVKGFIIYRPYGYAIWEEIQNYLSKKGSYKTLNLVVASTSLNFSKNTFNIDPEGMTSDTGDGFVLFGYEPINTIEQEVEEENFEQRKSLYDFVFPIDKENSISLNEFPSFAIYFDTKSENYYIQDFNMGIGALMKVKK